MRSVTRLLIEKEKKMLFVYYPKCTTCQRAEKWLDAHHLSYEERRIKEDPITAVELSAWYEKSGLPLRRFFNTERVSL